ncbi:hypothetical protein L1987_44487 [Smallanthus sonchifolius]|uniref:Uncharacterized protein n=1 Tax=Smallanthus sonchifolius TaxID=185202 RepID=A0ACB9GPE1_9ASTR|nr:hypothetical protein L1987_44487 [Smallanthus sonchifolius]
MICVACLFGHKKCTNHGPPLDRAYDKVIAYPFRWRVSMADDKENFPHAETSLKKGVVCAGDILKPPHHTTHHHFIFSSFDS